MPLRTRTDCTAPAAMPRHTGRRHIQGACTDLHMQCHCRGHPHRFPSGSIGFLLVLHEHVCTAASFSAALRGINADATLRTGCAFPVLAGELPKNCHSGQHIQGKLAWRAMGCACTSRIACNNAVHTRTRQHTVVDVTQSNSAKYTGGAIHIAYCNNVRPSFPRNKFISEYGNMQANANAVKAHIPLPPPLTMAALCRRQQGDHVQRPGRVQPEDLPQGPAWVPQAHARGRRLSGPDSHRQHLFRDWHRQVFPGEIVKCSTAVAGLYVCVLLPSTVTMRCSMTGRGINRAHNILEHLLLQAWFFP